MVESIDFVRWCFVDLKKIYLFVLSFIGLSQKFWFKNLLLILRFLVQKVGSGHVITCLSFFVLCIKVILIGIDAFLLVMQKFLLENFRFLEWSLGVWQKKDFLKVFLNLVGYLIVFLLFKLIRNYTYKFIRVIYKLKLICFMRSFSNLISHLRNASMIHNSFTFVPISNFNLRVLDIFYNHGIIAGYSSYDFKVVKVFVAYLPNGMAVSGSLKIISCSSRRAYVSWKKLVNYYSGVFCLVSSSKGLLTGTEAIRFKVGGELVCSRSYYLYFKFYACN